jgi:flagellar hook-length control protein FliK
MAQIFPLLQLSGSDQPTLTPAIGGDCELLSLSVEGQMIELTFDQALQQLLDGLGGEEAALLFATHQPVAVQTQVSPEILSTTAGKPLPLVQQSDGKMLPLAATQEALPESEALPVSSLPIVKLSSLFGAVLPCAEEIVRCVNVVPTLANGENKLLVDTISVKDMALQPSHTTSQLLPHIDMTSRSSLVLPLNHPVGQPGWDQALGERVQWMINQNIQQAEIKLTPPNLGPMEIKVSLQNDQTNVTFLAAQAPTREVLEASIPRLREMLGDVNLNLANVNVGQQQAGGSGQGEAAGGQRAGLTPHSDSTSSSSVDEHQNSLLVGRGLLDTYV